MPPRCAPLPHGEEAGEIGLCYLTEYHFSVMAVLIVEQYGDRYRLLKLPYPVKKERMFASPDTAAEASASARLANNVSRAKGKVLEYGYCNQWDYFVTLTLDGALRDRFDLPSFVKALGVWVGNYNKRFGTKLRYILIPEQHKDGAYHMHGLFSGVAADSLCKNEYGYLDMPYYRKHFGYISLDKLRNKDKAVSYITKYISKGFAQTDIESGKHLYYVSKNLDTKCRIWQCQVENSYKMDFENEYCGISWCPKNWSLEQFVFSQIQKGEKEDAD